MGQNASLYCLLIPRWVVPKNPVAFPSLLCNLEGHHIDLSNPSCSFFNLHVNDE